jgi:hypothetical protein
MDSAQQEVLTWKDCRITSIEDSETDIEASNNYLQCLRLGDANIDNRQGVCTTIDNVLLFLLAYSLLNIDFQLISHAMLKDLGHHAY